MVKLAKNSRYLGTITDNELSFTNTTETLEEEGGPSLSLKEKTKNVTFATCNSFNQSSPCHCSAGLALLLHLRKYESKW